MIRQAPLYLLRQPLTRSLQPHARRLLTTAPPQNVSRSWKNKAVRLGLAIGVVYFYNTSNIFAEEPAYAAPPPQAPPLEPPQPSLEETLAARHKKTVYSSPDPSSELDSSPAQAQTQTQPPESSSASPDLSETESEASSEGAFNEATGEINWDCPCLGGMAHGPCGEQFRTAFSCFVYSKEEPKGMECIEHFKDMQGCFREHPEIYGSELEEEEVEEELLQGQGKADDDAGPAGEAGEDALPAASRSTADAVPPVSHDTSDGSPQTSSSLGKSHTATSLSTPSSSTTPVNKRPTASAADRTQRAKEAKAQVDGDFGHPQRQTSESENLVPRAAHDATDAK